MEGEGQHDLQTPLLLAFVANDLSRGSGPSDGLKHKEGKSDEKLPPSPPKDTLLLPEESSMASLPCTKGGGGGVIQRGRGGKHQQLTESSTCLEESPTSSSSSKAKQEQVTTVADMRLVLVYGQWIWPLLLFSGATNIYNPEDQWVFSMIGNALMLSVLWWITAAPPTATITTETMTESRRHPLQEQHQQLGRSDILPTVVWGVVPPSSMFFMDRPEAFSVLLLLLFLPFLLLQVVRIKRYGFQATCNGLFDCCCGSTIWNRISVFTEHFVSFKHLEEEYFEQLREQEDEESRRLLEQQERLAYLEEENKKNGKIISKKLPRMWPIYIVFVLSIVSFGSFLYNSFVLIPRFSHPSTKTMKGGYALRPAVRPIIRDQLIRPSSIRHIMSAVEWEKVLSDNPSVFVHFNAPWAVYCQRLMPVWEAFSEEATRSLGHNEVEAENLVVAQVDCVALNHLCTSLKVMGFPTLRWYQNGKNLQNYPATADRTVESFLAYSKQKLNDYRIGLKPTAVVVDDDE